jgi:NTP pyrophosphatase (non-canonical NTP hydrolase)
MLNELGVEIIKVNMANGWDVMQPDQWGDAHKVPSLLALITSETSEALEAFRKNDKENFAEECADQIMRLLDLTTGLGIDIDTALAKKLEKNRSRGYKHGGKRV